MLYDLQNMYIGTKIFCILCIILIILISLKIFSNCKAKQARRNHEERRRIRFERIYTISAIAIFALAIVLPVYGIVELKIKANNELQNEANNKIIAKIFTPTKNTKKEENEQYRKVLHMDWIPEDFTKVDRDTLNKYKKNTNAIFSQIPKQQPNVFEEKKQGKDFDDDVKTFSAYVAQKKKNALPKDLWEGYEAGKRVSEVYHYSENIYQMANLAEGAHANAYIMEQNLDSTIMYAAGAVSSYEEFLGFSKKDAGMNRIITECEVSFYYGKILYRESTTKMSITPKERLHYQLFSYCCFGYAVEDTKLEDANYLMYMYYWGSSLIEMSTYIEDNEVLRELYKEELDYWDDLEEIPKEKINRYNIEQLNGETKNDALQRIWNIKEQVQEYLEK